MLVAAGRGEDDGVEMAYANAMILFFFFAEKAADINPAKLQRGPHKDVKIQRTPLCNTASSSTMAPSVARRRSYAP
jgi:hypothetical protein